MHNLEDKYLTIEKPAEGFFKDRNSKFLSFVHPVTNEDKIKEIQKKIRKEYHDARHHCFAWKLGMDNNNYRVNDDGEPNNSAGQPILGQILSNNLTNVLIIVVRYFGGTKLGIPGLINAYKTSAADAINNAEIIEKYICDIYSFEFAYGELNIVMKLIKDNDLQIIKQEFDLDCEIELSIKKSKTEKILYKFELIKNIRSTYLKTI